MRLAVSRRDRDAAPVYIDVVAYDGLAEICAEHLEKGREVAVSGRLDYQQWEHEGAKRSKHEVIAAEVEFLARAQQDAQDDPERSQDKRPALCALRPASRQTSGRARYRGGVDPIRLPGLAVRVAGARVPAYTQLT